jgi:plasmid stability protein
MGSLLRIRDLPEDVHRTLKTRAAAAGTSVSDYARQVLAQAAQRPTPTELAARIAATDHEMLSEPSERLIRRLRDDA